VLDGAHSTFTFRVKHFWGLMTVQGHLRQVDGRAAVDRRVFGMTLNVLGMSAATVLLVVHAEFTRELGQRCPCHVLNQQPPRSVTGRGALAWADIVKLAPGQLVRFHQLRTNVSPAGLEDCIEYERGGIAIRLRSQGPGSDHTACMRSPSAKRSPAQHAWAACLVDLTTESFVDSFARNNLEEVCRYLTR
jgi:hypothetical protein